MLLNRILVSNNAMITTISYSYVSNSEFSYLSIRTFLVSVCLLVLVVVLSITIWYVDYFNILSNTIFSYLVAIIVLTVLTTFISSIIYSFFLLEFVTMLSFTPHNINGVNTIQIVVILIIMSEVLLFISIFASLLGAQFTSLSSLYIYSSGSENTIDYSISVVSGMILSEISVYGTILLSIASIVSSYIYAAMFVLFIVNSYEYYIVSFIIVFMLLQVNEYRYLWFNINDSLLLGLFYIITALHMLHIVCGVIMISILFYDVSHLYASFTNNLNNLEFNYINQFNPSLLQFAHLYWHFVEFLWLFILLIVYIY